MLLNSEGHPTISLWFVPPATKPIMVLQLWVRFSKAFKYNRIRGNIYGTINRCILFVRYLGRILFRLILNYKIILLKRKPFNNHHGTNTFNYGSFFQVLMLYPTSLSFNRNVLLHMVHCGMWNWYYVGFGTWVNMKSTGTNLQENKINTKQI